MLSVVLKMLFVSATLSMVKNSLYVMYDSETKGIELLGDGHHCYTCLSTGRR